MQNNLKTMLCLTSIGALAACGGSGGGLAGASSAAAALDYNPVYADSPAATVGNAIAVTGATGVAVIYNPIDQSVSFESVQVSKAVASDNLFLTINGSTLTLTDTGSGKIFSDGSTIFQYGLTSEQTFQEIGSAGISGLREGFVGVETRTNNLPSGTTKYEGSFDLGLQPNEIGNFPDTFLGQIDIDVNFDDSSLSGSLFFALDEIATISGGTEGNGILGTVTMTADSGYSGEGSIVGKAYGQTGGDLAGVLGGTGITEISSGDQYIMYGTFDAEID